MAMPALLESDKMIKYKGKLKTIKELPENTLPKGAVRFKEPKTLWGLVFASLPFSCLACGINCLIVLGINEIEINDIDKMIFNPYGFLIFLFTMMIHEMIHALAYPLNSEVQIFMLPNMRGMCVWSKAAISKVRYIYMSLMPYFVLSVLPAICMYFVQLNGLRKQLFIGYLSYSGLSCGGDFLNVFNALIQMPRKSKEVLNKMNSYWFIEGKNESSN